MGVGMTLAERLAAVFDRRDVSSSAKLIAVNLIRRASKGGDHCRVGIRRIAEDTGTSESTVKRALSELEQAGMVSRNRTGRTTSYRLVMGHSDLSDGSQRPIDRRRLLEDVVKDESLVSGAAPDGQPPMEKIGTVLEALKIDCAARVAELHDVSERDAQGWIDYEVGSTQIATGNSLATWHAMLSWRDAGCRGRMASYAPDIAPPADISARNAMSRGLDRVFGA